MIVLAQLRGTEYAVAEIVWWMVVSLVIGFAIGWLVRSLGKARKVEEHYSGKLERSEQRISRLEADVETSKADVRDVTTKLTAANDALGEAHRKNRDLEAQIDAGAVERESADEAEQAAQGDGAAVESKQETLDFE